MPHEPQPPVLVENNGDWPWLSPHPVYAYIPNLPLRWFGKLYKRARDHNVIYPVRYPIDVSTVNLALADGLTITVANDKTEAIFLAETGGNPLDLPVPSYDPNLVDPYWWSYFDQDVRFPLLRTNLPTVDGLDDSIYSMQAVIVWMQLFRDLTIWKRGIITASRRGRPPK